MIRMGLIALLLATALLPVAASADPRLVEQMYDPDKVVRIEGRTKVQATIRFGEGEAIENVAIGDSNAWQVTPNKRASVLFVKPLSSNARTNMTVITNRHVYLFDLVANPKARPLYILTFTYPEPVEPEGQTGLAELTPPQSANALELAAANDPYAVVDPAALNFNWTRKGAGKLLPQQIYDDGTATFLAWPAGASVPAILIRDADGTEGPVNFTVRGDIVVVDGVPREIILRSGEEVAMLTNTAPPGPVESRQAALARPDNR